MEIDAVKIEKLELSSFIQILRNSISGALKNYPVFLLVGAVPVLLGYLVAYFDLTLVDFIFNEIWFGGVLIASQAYFVKKDFFLLSRVLSIFKNPNLMKRLIPSFVFNLLIGIAVLGIVGALALTLKSLQVDSFYLTRAGFLSPQLWTVVLIFAVFLTMPLMFFSALLLFRDLSWRVAARLSCRGAWKNRKIVLLCFLPSLLYVPLENIEHAAEILELILEPFLLLSYYELYKKVFAFETADQILSA